MRHFCAMISINSNLIRTFMKNFSAVVIINDCHDSGTATRQTARISALLGLMPSFIKLDNFSDLEGAGHIIDALDAFTGKPGIILANAAPRHGQGKKWPNGTPFCYFYVGESLVISTVQGSILSLVKKLGLTSEIHIVQVDAVMNAMLAEGLITQDVAERTIISQFRSYDFTPRLAAWIAEERTIPSEIYDFNEIAEVGHTIWFVDNFGNCKTTILPEYINFTPGEKVQTKIGELMCYNRLKDVPNSEPGLIVGSSGIDNRRFLEVVVQGKSAANIMNIGVGTVLFD